MDGASSGAGFARPHALDGDGRRGRAALIRAVHTAGGFTSLSGGWGREPATLVGGFKTIRPSPDLEARLRAAGWTLLIWPSAVAADPHLAAAARALSPTALADEGELLGGEA